jgi:tRNA modification GTPase
MTAYAAVMTAKATGPIATIQLHGTSAEKIIKKIFSPDSKKTPQLKPGKILVGTIKKQNTIIDHVTIACLDENNFAIHPHGNPIIVEKIVKLLQSQKAKIISADQLLTKTLSADKSLNSIAIEAKLNLPKARTLTGTKLIANQIEKGLNCTAQTWLENINPDNLEKIKAGARQILSDTAIAKFLIRRSTVIIAGPPNAGKSTLLNTLCGKTKAVVTEIPGTTRDWVSADCQIGPLPTTLIDTAGLDRQLAAPPQGDIEKLSQQKSLKLLTDADIVLLVLDVTQPADQLTSALLEKIAGKNVLTVLNKSDLTQKLDEKILPPNLNQKVKISAKTGQNLESLIEQIRKISRIESLDLNAPICTTERQKSLLKKLAAANSTAIASSLIQQLLNAPLRV